MSNVPFELSFALEASGDRDNDGGYQRVEVRNDAKYLLIIVGAIDTSKEPYKNRRRTILRLYRTLFEIGKGWAEDVQRLELTERDVNLNKTIDISPETMEFLKELTDKCPEGIQYRSIPVQELLVSIEDQYDAWKRGDNAKDVAEKKAESPVSSTD